MQNGSYSEFEVRNYDKAPSRESLAAGHLVMTKDSGREIERIAGSWGVGQSLRFEEGVLVAGDLLMGMNRVQCR